MAWKARSAASGSAFVASGLAAEERAHTLDELGRGLEVVEAAVVDERADEVGPAEGDHRGRRAALAEPGEERTVESERLDEGDDVVGEHVEGRRAAGVHGGA